MFTRIVVGVEGSPPADVAAHTAINLAAREHAELHVVSVVEELPHYTSAREEAVREESAAHDYFTALHARVREAAERKGVTVVSRVLVGNEARELLTYPVEVKADLLVIGSAGHSAIWESALGGTALQLTRHTPCSLLIVRSPSAMAQNGRLGVALDGSPLGWESFAAGLSLARHARAPLQVLSIAEDRALGDRRRTQDDRSAESAHSWQTFLVQVQARAIARAATAGVAIIVSIHTGPTSEALVGAARDLGVEMLILGATGQERPWAQTTGGTAIKVAEEAPCDVLLVRPRTGGVLVRDIMVPAGFVARPETPASEVLDNLLDGAIRLVPVVSGVGKLEGIITLGLLLRKADSALAAHLVELRTPAQGRAHLDRLVAGRPASDFMLRRPYVLQPDVLVGIAGRYLTAHQVTRVPVIDAARSFLGLLSEREVIAALVAHPVDVSGAASDRASPEHAPAGAASGDAGGDVTVGAVTDTRVPRLLESASLDEVVATLQATASGVVLITRTDQRVLGIVDDHSLLRNTLPGETTPFGVPLLRALARSSGHTFRLPRGGTSEPRIAASLLRPGVPVLRADQPLAEALARLISSGTSDLAIVVTPDDLPLGIVRSHTALRALVRG